MKKNYLVLYLFLTFFLFISCSKSVVFNKEIVFPNANWSVENKTLTFDVPLKGSANPYSVIFEMDLIGTPNVNSIYTTFQIFTPRGAETLKPIYFNFLSPQEPYIMGASSSEKTYRLVAYSKKYFSESGDYKFVLIQHSNNADNYNIRSLRMYIKKVKE